MSPPTLSFISSHNHIRHCSIDLESRLSHWNMENKERFNISGHGEEDTSFPLPVSNISPPAREAGSPRLDCATVAQVIISCAMCMDFGDHQRHLNTDYHGLLYELAK